MSLSFLSKKTWHTTNLKNVEQVWLAEKKQEEEQKKLEMWKKAREEERQKAELRELQQEVGNVPKGPERVDFLYEAQQPKSAEYLMGKPVELDPEDSDVKKVESVPGSNFINGQNNLSSASNEMFNKMNNDPLMVMRAEEQKALKRIVSNPVKMKQIRAAVDIAESSLKRKKEHKDHKKKHKKEHKHKKHKEHKRRREEGGGEGRRRRRGSSSSESSEGGAPAAEAARAGPSVAAAPRDAPAMKPGYGLQLYSGGAKVGTPASDGAGAGHAAREAPARNDVASAAVAAAAAVPTQADLREAAAQRARERRAQRRAPLSEEEKAARVRAMMSDAESHQAGQQRRAADQREQKRREREEEEEEAAAAVAKASAGGDDERRPDFLDQTARDVYSDSNVGSVAERINQQKHYVQRGHRASAENFLRPS